MPPETRHGLTLPTLMLLFALSACGGGGGGGAGGGNSGGTTPAPPQPDTSTAPDNPPPAQQPVVTAEVTRITLLALYTPGVEAQFSDVDLRVSHLVNVSNDVMEQSAVAVQFELNHIERVDYPDSGPMSAALDDVTYADHPAFNHIEQLRQDTQADLVVLFRPYANDGNCGFAWVGGYQTDGDFSNPAQADWGYSVVASNCSDYTLLHELGHNLGLAHSRREDPEGGTFDYAVGHGVDGDFVTIMASPDEFNAARLPRLSSPLLSCNGSPCGVPHTDSAEGSDAVRTLGISAEQVAAYR